MKFNLFSNFACILLLGGGSQLCFAQGSVENVNVETPGDFKNLILDLESTRIDELTVSGRMNASDVAYLTGGVGKLAHVRRLDLSGVELVAGDEPYKSFKVGSSGIGLGSKDMAYFYISDDERYEEETIVSSGLTGGVSTNYYYYGKNLAGAFANSEAFEEVVLPASLSAVGDYMFWENVTVTTPVLPDGIKVIGGGAFGGCSKIKSLRLPESVDSVGPRAFAAAGTESVEGLEQVTGLGEYAFWGAAIKGEIDMSGLREVPQYAFSNVNRTGGIESVIFSDELESIGDGAFSDCTMTAVVLPDGVKRIGSYAFRDCLALESVLLPSTIEDICATSFSGTPWFASLQGEGGVVYIGNIAVVYDNKSAADSDIISFKEGTVAIANNFCSDVENRGKYSHIVFPASLRRIGNNSFGNLPNLEYVELPENLEEVGASSFVYCSKLWIDEWPKRLKRIGIEAFGCTGVTSVTLSEGLEEIGEAAFMGCKALSQVVYNARNAKVELDEFYGYPPFSESSLSVVKIGGGVERLPNDLFAHCSELERVKFEASETEVPLEIGDRCFVGAVFTEIDLPERTVSVGKEAFDNCFGLERVGIPVCRSIGESAFVRCYKLATITFPDNLEYIGKKAFQYTALKKVEIPDGMDYLWIDEGAFEELENLTEVSVPAACQNLGEWAFANCPLLGRFEWRSAPAAVAAAEEGREHTIGARAFVNGDLKQLELPEGIKNIGDMAFGNLRLTKLSLPSTIEKIGKDLFYDLKNFSPARFECYAFVPPTVDAQWLSGKTGATIYVPAAAVEAYKQDALLGVHNIQPVDGQSENEIVKIEGNMRVVVGGDEIAVSGVSGRVVVSGVDGRVVFNGEAGKDGAVTVAAGSGVYVVSAGGKVVKVVK